MGSTSAGKSASPTRSRRSYSTRAPHSARTLRPASTQELRPTWSNRQTSTTSSSLSGNWSTRQRVPSNPDIEINLITRGLALLGWSFSCRSQTIMGQLDLTVPLPFPKGVQLMVKKVKIIGVRMDLGAGRRGVDMGPSVIRIAGLNQAIARLGYEVIDAGNVHIHPPEAIGKTSHKARFLREIASAAAELEGMVEDALNEGALPVVLGGDHSIAIGSAAGVAAYYRNRGEKIGIIWLDAHTDINTPDNTPSGNIHGMHLSALLGNGAAELTGIGGFSPKVLPQHTVIIGARSVDPGEREMIKSLGIRVYTMSELDERGMAEVIEEALEIASRNTAGFHVTMDMDFLD